MLLDIIITIIIAACLFGAGLCFRILWAELSDSLFVEEKNSSGKEVI